MYRYDSAEDQDLLARFERHLIDAGFSHIHCAEHLDRVDRFLSYLRQAGISPEAVTPEDLSHYLRAQSQKYRRKHGAPCRLSGSTCELEPARAGEPPPRHRFSGA